MISLSSTISRVVFASLLFASAFGVSHGEQNDISTLLGRLNDLESKVEALKDEVVALTTELQSQNELIMSLEALVTRSRFLADDECLFTFANDTGTPTCSVAYQLIAGQLLDFCFIVCDSVDCVTLHCPILPRLVLCCVVSSLVVCT